MLSVVTVCVAVRWSQSSVHLQCEMRLGGKGPILLQRAKGWGGAMLTAIHPGEKVPCKTHLGAPYCYGSLCTAPAATTPLASSGTSLPLLP